MGTFKVVFVLCSILLMFLMGTFGITSKKSKPDHPSRKAAFTDTGGHVDSHESKLKSTDREYVQLEDIEDQGKTREPRRLEEIDFYTRIKTSKGTDSITYTPPKVAERHEEEIKKPEIDDPETDAGDGNEKRTRHAKPRLSKVVEGFGYQGEMGKPGIQDHTESYTMDILKTGTDSVSYTPSKVAERYEEEIKKPEIGDPETDAGDGNEKGTDSITYTPPKVAERYEEEIKKPEIDDPETDAGDGNEKSTRLRVTKTSSKSNASERWRPVLRTSSPRTCHLLIVTVRK